MKASEDTVVKSSQLRDIDFPKAPRSQELIDQQVQKQHNIVHRFGNYWSGHLR
jgi:hypothetical protein